MGMQIDGTVNTAQITSYSRVAASGGKSQGSETGGTGSAVPKSGGNGSRGSSTADTDAQNNADIQRQIQELIQIQNKVILHEQAHMSVGGELAGSASYSYTIGPDGKRYVSGGEVSISMPAVEDPEERARIMAKVQAAALAPADPSPQDMRVASSASMKEAQARIELIRKRAEIAYGSSSGQNSQATSAQTVKNPQRTAPGSLLDISI